MTQSFLKIRRRIVLPLVLIILLSACSAAPPRDEEPTITGAEANAMAQRVAATVEASINERLAALEEDPDAPPLQLDDIVAQVLDRIPTPTPEPEQPLQVNYTDPLATTGLGLDLEQTLIDLYRRANPAVVYIIVPPLGTGSGFVYDEDGHIITNNHVVHGGRSYEIVFANGDRRAARLVGWDVDSDLAVLKVDELPEGVEPLPLAEPDDIQVGQFAVAIGNPFGEQGSMSLGIISGLDRSLRSQRAAAGSAFSLPEVIQTDAPINPGNSGGPLLNLRGQVIGVNSAIATNTGANSGVGFSIPVAAVRRLVPTLISDGSYTYPYMGASFDDEISLGEQTIFDLPQTKGAYVLGVSPDGPAAQAGLIAADPNTGRGGDLIVQIDDAIINDFSDLNSYLVFHTKVGQTISITVLRDGERMTVDLTLGARP